MSATLSPEPHLDRLSRSQVRPEPIIDWHADNEPLVRWACRVCGSTAMISIDTMTTRCRGELAVDGDEPAFVDEDCASSGWDIWAETDYQCDECGIESSSLPMLLVRQTLRVGDRVRCPDGHEGRLETHEAQPGWVVPVVGGVAYDLQELQPVTGPLPSQTLLDLVAIGNELSTGPDLTLPPSAPIRAEELGELETEEKKATESYWELGARKYFEGVFEARMVDDGLQIPQGEVDRSVRRLTAMLAYRIEESVEDFMSFDFDFDFSPYRP